MPEEASAFLAAAHFRLRAAVFARRQPKGLAKDSAKAARALKPDGLGDGGDILRRLFEAQRGFLHAVLFHVRGDALAIDLLEYALERRCVHEVFAGKLLDR